MNTITVSPGDLDEALRNNRQPGTFFILHAGEYTTRGGFAFESSDLCALAPECVISGAGKNRTIIRALNVDTQVNGQDARYAEILTAGARTKGKSDHVGLRDFTLDCSAVTVPVIGIHAFSTCATIENVRVTGIWGRRDWEGPVTEGFGIIVNNAWEANYDGGHTVRRCVVEGADTHSVENYMTGVYVGCVQRGKSIAYSRVLETCVLGISEMHAAYGLNNNLLIEDCEAHNSIRALFCDTKPGYDVQVTRFRGHDCRWALELHAYDDDVRKRVTLTECKFVFRRVDDWAQAVLLEDFSGSGRQSIADIELVNSVFVAQGPNASKGRSNGAAVEGVRTFGCRWMPVDAEHPWQAPVLQRGAGAWVEK